VDRPLTIRTEQSEIFESGCDRAHSFRERPTVVNLADVAGKTWIGVTNQETARLAD
jgi:hypothetical protein